MDLSSLYTLIIYGNDLLTECDVLSICDYLAAPASNTGISYNSQGCNSIPEVEDACGLVDVEEMDRTEINIYPNPVNGILHVSNLPADKEIELRLYNHLGQAVLKENIPSGSIDLSYLAPGFYIIRIAVEDDIMQRKLVVQ